jgi:hypothetical protein
MGGQKTFFSSAPSRGRRQMHHGARDVPNARRRCAVDLIGSGKGGERSRREKLRRYASQRDF